ncbi:MAG: hypothetical protein ACHBN1_13760 [Heteroscytonema crispum UTEX LB 1556]
MAALANHQQPTTNPFSLTLVGTLDYSKGASLSLPRSAPPVAWVGKPYRESARARRGESSRLQTQAPLHHQRPFGRTSTRSVTLPQYALHHQPLTTNNQPTIDY